MSIRSKATKGFTATLKTADYPALTLWPLLLGIGLLFAVGVGAVAVATWLFGREADEIASRGSVEQVERVLAERTDSLKTMLIDWAWWNEAIQKLVLEPDLEYADYNLGTFTHTKFGLYAALTVDPDDRLVFAYENGEPAAADHIRTWMAKLLPMIAQARAMAFTEPHPVSAFMDLGGQVALVSVSAMQNEEGTPSFGWERPPVIVFAQAVDGTFLESVARSAGIDSARLVLPVALPPGQPGMFLRDAENAKIGALVWQARLPSAGVLARLWPTLAVVALIMLVIGAFLAARVLAYARRYRAERIAREAQLSAAMLEARTADHAKSQFLANMSHELRTPLNAMIGYCEMLRLGYFGPLTAKQGEYIDGIETASRHLATLLTDILDIAKIAAGREELVEEAVDIEAVAAKAVAISAPRARERGVALLVDGPPSLKIYGDARRTLQMVLNLLSNAVRFSPQGVPVRLGWRIDAAGGVVLSVRDRGPGIPEEDISRVLQPFHRRVHSTVRDVGESNGLGLPLTAQMMRLHGGMLALVNGSDGGLCAELRFPPERTRGREAPAVRQPALAEADAF